MTGNKDVKQLSRSPYHLLKRAAQYAAHIYQGEVGKSGLTQRQFTVLFAVDRNEGISQTALVKLTGIDRSTLADLVARLLAQGYLQRRRTKDDARTNSLRITAAGPEIPPESFIGVGPIPTIQRALWPKHNMVTREEADRSTSWDFRCGWPRA